jgi:hypothetical protein
MIKIPKNKLMKNIKLYNNNLKIISKYNRIHKNNNKIR